MASKDLPGPIPSRGEAAERLLAWVTGACDRKHNPIVDVHRYGFELDARLVIRMANGDQLRVRQRDVMGANGLRHVMLAYDGTVLPRYDQASCGQIVSRIIWASEASVQADEIETLIDDVSAFLDLTLNTGIVEGRYDDEDGHRLVADFVYWNRRGGFPVLALNRAADPFELWVSRRRLVEHLRELNSKAHVPDVRGSLEEVGWRWVNHQRRDGDDRPIARTWVLPMTWDRCAFDLADTVQTAERKPPQTRLKRVT